MRTRSAFTLVELLVVIGIITFLVGILLPALNKARTAAYKTATLSNLRQIGVSVTIYQGEYKGHLPTNLTDVNEDGRAFAGLELLAHLYHLPNNLFINPHTNDTPATQFDPISNWPVLADIAGVPITLTTPAAIDSSNVRQVNWHCSFSYDHEKKRSGRKGLSHVYLGDRADYANGRSYSVNWDGKGMCLLWSDQHADFVSTKYLTEQLDPNMYHHNQYYDDSGHYPGEGGAESNGPISTTSDTLDTHLRFFSEDEDDALLPNP